MKRWLIALTICALVLVPVATASTELPLTVVAETPTTITFSWTPPAGAQGYKFFVASKQVSNSQSGSVSSVRFGKAPCDGQADCYEVSAQTELARGGWKKKPACSNGRDDDGDGLIDYPADPGCSSATDNDETDPAPPPPPPPTTISPAQFSAMATSGATIENVTVTGDVIVRNPNVTLRNDTFQGSVEWYNLADGGKMLGSRALDLFIWGADNLLVDGNTFDGQNHTDGGKMWDMNGDVPQNVTISNNTFRNQQTGNSADHSQAMFVGYSDGVLISGNTFVNNGSTADLFFSWYTETNPSESRTYPRNVCVKGNSFSDPNHLHYFAINFRAEITTIAHIVTDPNEVGFSTTSPQFNGTC